MVGWLTFLLTGPERGPILLSMAHNNKFDSDRYCSMVDAIAAELVDVFGWKPADARDRVQAGSCEAIVRMAYSGAVDAYYAADMVDFTFGPDRRWRTLGTDPLLATL